MTLIEIINIVCLFLILFPLLCLSFHCNTCHILTLTSAVRNQAPGYRCGWRRAPASPPPAPPPTVLICPEVRGKVVQQQQQAQQIDCVSLHFSFLLLLQPKIPRFEFFLLPLLFFPIFHLLFSFLFVSIFFIFLYFKPIFFACFLF